MAVAAREAACAHPFRLDAFLLRRWRSFRGFAVGIHLLRRRLPGRGLCEGTSLRQHGQGDSAGHGWNGECARRSQRGVGTCCLEVQTTAFTERDAGSTSNLRLRGAGAGAVVKWSKQPRRAVQSAGGKWCRSARDAAPWICTRRAMLRQTARR